MAPETIIGLFISLTLALLFVTSVDASRSLLHWKNDLEHNLRNYRNQRETIDRLLHSSIQHPQAPDQLVGTKRVISSGGSVRFSDLIIPNGALILASNIAQAHAQTLVNRTQNYVAAKMNALQEVLVQLDSLNSRINDPNSRFINKGAPSAYLPQVNHTVIPGRRVFRTFERANFVEGNQIQLKTINFTDVDKVMQKTYREFPQMALVDKYNRLFFEGPKTFWRTVFLGELQSGCCGRLKPIDTTRVMRRTIPQVVESTTVFASNGYGPFNSVKIELLDSQRLHNQPITLAGQPSKPNEPLLLLGPISNVIFPNSLINISPLGSQDSIFKTLIFKDMIHVADARLAAHLSDATLKIALAQPNSFFELDQDKYLLKYSPDNPRMMQEVFGPVVVSKTSTIVQNIHAGTVNGIPKFNEFVSTKIVRVDRPAIIRSPVQFNAVPAVMEGYAQFKTPPEVVIMTVSGNLTVNTINGMSLPYDIVMLPHNGTIIVRGSMDFVNGAVFYNFLDVGRTVNGLMLPDEVIPLHLNDFIHSTGRSNLWFMDGIEINDLTVQTGKFDDLILDEVYGDAQSLVSKSAFVVDPINGTMIIKAPLKVANLRVHNLGQANSGLLNGVRPRDVMDFSEHQSDMISGKKTFLAHVEAAECSFRDLNGLQNWVKHLIRVDRPGVTQVVSSKLHFPHQMPPQPNALYQNQTLGGVHINNLFVEFLRGNDAASYATNFGYAPEFYILHHALMKGYNKTTNLRFRVLDQVRVINPSGGPALVNGITLDNIILRDKPVRFTDKYTMVGKVHVATSVRADRIQSNYPLDTFDLVQFDQYRIPIIGPSLAPIRLNNLVLAGENQAKFVHCRLLNGTPFSEFAASIMSLTRPQRVHGNFQYTSPVEFGGINHLESSFNGIQNFREMASRMKGATYVFDDGLQCNSLVMKT